MPTLDRLYIFPELSNVTSLVPADLIPGSWSRANAFHPLQTALAVPLSSSMRPPSTMLSIARAGRESPFSCLTMSPPGRVQTKVNFAGLSGNLYRAQATDLRTTDKMRLEF